MVIVQVRNADQVRLDVRAFAKRLDGVRIDGNPRPGAALDIEKRLAVPVNGKLLALSRNGKSEKGGRQEGAAGAKHRKDSVRLIGMPARIIQEALVPRQGGGRGRAAVRVTTQKGQPNGGQ